MVNEKQVTGCISAEVKKQKIMCAECKLKPYQSKACIEFLQAFEIRFFEFKDWRIDDVILIT